MKKRWIAALFVIISFYFAGRFIAPKDTAESDSYTVESFSEDTSGSAAKGEFDSATEETSDSAAGGNSITFPDGGSESPADTSPEAPVLTEVANTFNLKEVPAYTGSPYTEINGNVPFFTVSDLDISASFETYSELDSLSRCGTAFACIGTDLMPTEERGRIGMIQPSGWHTVKYDSVDGKYLYNRCHLIGYQLSGENANERNLITGTRYMNTEGMLPFENKVADFIRETGCHVLYRSTPCFDGENLLASGVLLEAFSVEDGGKGICFNVFVYNAQPGIAIDYATGESALKPEPEGSDINASEPDDSDTEESELQNSGTKEKEILYILNTSTKKFHDPDCFSAKKIADKNRQEYTGSREDLLSQGYTPCGNCNP